MTIQVPDGVFWADHIKTLKDSPTQRLELAEQYLPLPGAFREAVIALRALIRQRRQQGADYVNLLANLYRLAAQESFLFATPNVPGVGPAYNVAEAMPRDVWRNLDLPYREIGYEELKLVNKTDGRWLAST
jgi:hypothetical protein